MSSLPVPSARAVLGLFGLALAGCHSLQTSENFLGVVTPYRVEVVQGNVVTSEQVAQVKTGQTRAQVRDVLGSPLLADASSRNSSPVRSTSAARKRLWKAMVVRSSLPGAVAS